VNAIKPGKSIFQLYAIRRLCAEQKPFVWFSQKNYYLFVEDGVYRVPDGFSPGGFENFMRTLVDSDEAERIPEHLVVAHTCHFVIFSASPDEKRWDRLHKTVSEPLVLNLNPWTRWEIHQA
jgi:hypothetical protein